MFKLESPKDKKFEKVFYAKAPKMYEIIGENERHKMRAKCFKDGLITSGKMFNEVEQKGFYTIKSKSHNLKLNKITKIVKPENNNKRMIKEGYKTMPYEY
jgi:hypothetical protein